MADPLQVHSSLDTLADHYAVFEPDQVLTHGQLNSVADFLGDQMRLSRVALAGVGLIAGLHVSRSGAGVQVTRGLGVSTDGDLLMLPADTTYDRFRPYDSTAPVYRPFYLGTAADGTPTDMLALAELVPVGESDVLARPLADLPGGLADQAVLLLMETVVNDPDLCTGVDCDNLGRDALHRQRVLLIRRADAQALLDARPLRPAAERAQVVEALGMRRPALARDVANTTLLNRRLRDAAQASLTELLRVLPTLPAACPEVLTQVFGGDPVPRWSATLREHLARFGDETTGLQVWYGFVKDLVHQWNALREALLDDDAVLLPPVAAFPKHLLLGALDAPREQRSGLHPSPLDAKAREASAHARFLAWKLDTLIASFALPADTTLRITPSRGDAAPLEERAIPWHYRSLEAAPIHVAWNFRRSARRQQALNLGYRAAAWAAAAHVREPLAFGIAAHDFFRIEGHLGRPLASVSAELRREITSRNLPFQVQEVLLNSDKRLILRRPPIRYTPLHSLHYLVRQDVAWRLDESTSFSATYLKDVGDAVSTGQVPSTTETGASVVSLARGASEAVAGTKTRAQPVLGASKYSGYKAEVGGSGAAWKSSYATSLETVSNSRANLGHVSRADFVSPFDSLINSNQPHWIDWLDDLIQAQDERADDKLLFTRFVQDHPGLDHLGGVWRGGTFVLVYDDSGRVVADFTLPYPAAEIEEDEPDEPPLSRPPYRPPFSVGGGIRVIRPLDLKVQDRVLLERQQFQIDLDKQTANITGLVQGAFVPSNAVDPRVKPGSVLDSGDLFLDFKAKDMAGKRDRVKALQELVAEPSLPAETRTQVERELGRAQSELADSVAQVTERVVTGKVDVSGGTGSALSQQLGASVALIQDSGAKASLNTKLDQFAGQATAPQAALIGNLRKVGRF